MAKSILEVYAKEQILLWEMWNLCLVYVVDESFNEEKMCDINFQVISFVSY